MLAALLAITIVAFGTTGNGHTSPVPQATPLTAPLGASVSLGDLTIKIDDLRDATPADNPDQIPVLADERLMVIHISMANTAHTAYTGIVTYRLADKSGVGPRARDVKPRNLNVPQGGNIHLTGLFTVDKAFAPTTLVVECSVCNAGHYKAAQFTIPTP